MNFVHLLLQEATLEKNQNQFKTRKKIVGMLYGILYVKRENLSFFKKLIR